VVYLLLAIPFAVLCLAGLFMVLSASAAEIQSEFGSPWYQFQRQAMWLGIGALVLVVAARGDYRRLRPFIRYLLAGTIVLLVAVIVPGVGSTVNGSSRWLELGPLTVQPSELAKLALVLFAAELFTRRADSMEEYRISFIPLVLVMAAMGVLIMAQPNLGTTVLLVVIALAMSWAAGVPGRVLAVAVGVAATGAGLLAVMAPYRMRRLTAFTDPWADPLNTGYQTIQSQAALANGGLTGQGLGRGRSKFGFLPEGHTDFIFSNVGEEFGLVGALVVVGLFVVIAVAGVWVATNSPDRFGALVAVGITTWITVQALVNLGAAVGLLPITGVPLPLVSAGGSSLIVTMAACGVLLSIARRVPT
jgi:cell division protein FtsW